MDFTEATNVTRSTDFQLMIGGSLGFGCVAVESAELIEEVPFFGQMEPGSLLVVGRKCRTLDPEGLRPLVVVIKPFIISVISATANQG